MVYLNIACFCYIHSTMNETADEIELVVSLNKRYAKYEHCWTLLPPANEVWVKVIFSQMSVCPQGGGRRGSH